MNAFVVDLIESKSFVFPIVGVILPLFFIDEFIGVAEEKNGFGGIEFIGALG